MNYNNFFFFELLFDELEEFDFFDDELVDLLPVEVDLVPEYLVELVVLDDFPDVLLLLE